MELNLVGLDGDALPPLPRPLAGGRHARVGRRERDGGRGRGRGVRVSGRAQGRACWDCAQKIILCATMGGGELRRARGVGAQRSCRLVTCVFFADPPNPLLTTTAIPRWARHQSSAFFNTPARLLCRGQRV